jgi:transcriptional regulator with XRE-family HTH domain
MNVLRNIKRYMAFREIKQQYLADKMGVTKQNLSSILSQKDMKLSTLFRIAKALEVPPEIFLKDIADPFVMTSTLKTKNLDQNGQGSVV